MRIILGGIGTGKSLVITKEAYEKSLEHKVLIITDNVKDTYQKLQLISKATDVTEITIFGANTFSQVMRYLIQNNGKYNSVFVDICSIGSDAFSEAKLEGFAIGANLDMSVAMQSSVYGLSGKVAVYEVVDGERKESKLYSRQDIQSILSELGVPK